MAYLPHIRFQFGGPIYGASSSVPDEIWQCTVNCDAVAITDYDAHLAGLVTPMLAWWNDGATFAPANAALQWMKLNPIGTDGLYSDPTHPHTLDLTGDHNGTHAVTYPTFCSLAYSWTTSATRGPGSRGRIYPPNAYAYASGAGEIVRAADQANAALAAKLLLTQIHTTVDGAALTPVIASKVSGTNRPINGARVGQTIDVQRRRKNKIPESYVFQAYP